MFLMEYGEDWSVSSAYLSEESIRTLSPQAASFIGGVLRNCERALTVSAPANVCKILDTTIGLALSYTN